MTDTKMPKDDNDSTSDAQNPSSDKDNTHQSLEKPAKSIGNSMPNSTASSMNNKSATSPSSKNPTPSNKAKISKIAILALLVAIVSGVGVGGIHYLHNLQNSTQSEELVRQLTALNNASEQRIKQSLSDQKSAIDHQVNKAVLEIKNTGQSRITKLEEELENLKQNQPSDWLIHDAEYLVRIATRTIWLEHDTTTAINLLEDADGRIKKLNDPQYLNIRQIIREDIEALKLMPTLNTEDVILTLLAMSKQLPQLSFSMAKIPDTETVEEDLVLSNNASDWRNNLAKTWQKFLNDFITIRSRTGDVEPLMPPQYQQSLKENLALKLQQAQWAASEEKSDLFMQTLDDVQQWLTEYYDMGHLETAQFYQGIQLLKSKIIRYDYPSSLLSLKAIRKVLANKPLIPTMTKIDQSNESVVPNDSKTPVQAIPNTFTDSPEQLELTEPTEKDQIKESPLTSKDA
jgi:uroporphyrin-3 C-methyltransferase